MPKSGWSKNIYTLTMLEHSDRCHFELDGDVL